MILLKKLLIAVGAVLIIYALFSAICDIRQSRMQSGKKTQSEITKLHSLVQSQDKAIEHVYINASKEVQKKNAEIREHIKTLSPDAVADGLNALLAEYRGERDAGD